MAGEEIKFNLNSSGSAGLNSDGSFNYVNDSENKINDKLKPIFEAIARLGGDTGKVDTAEERNLLRKLKSVFAADGDEKVSDTDLAMLDSFNSTTDVKAFINQKVTENNVTPTGLEEEETPAGEKTDKQRFSEWVNREKGNASTDNVETGNYGVLRGDSFWKIAQNQLVAEGNTHPTSSEIVNCQKNRTYRETEQY